MTYEIRIKGYLAADWSEWFQGMRITHTPEGETVLAGAVRDQAALVGVVIKLHDLGLTLISARQTEANQE